MKLQDENGDVEDAGRCIQSEAPKWKPRSAKPLQKTPSNNFFEPLSSGNLDRDHLRRGPGPA
jgi:hypothetical protein